MDLLRDRVYPVTRRSNASKCNITFERYVLYIINASSHLKELAWAADINSFRLLYNVI